MSEALEIQQIVEHLQGTLDNLITRGLRTAGMAERNALATLGDEFERIGAGHLAQRVLTLRDALEADDPDAPKRLLMAQASLRLFERILTLEVARGALKHWKHLQTAAREDADEPASQ